ncbi:hypothetical protein HPULCUR_010432 [Helicostylum pulchrum]|uniref:Uncharacterized protein n=1 Tax=Helicostylum pulchrum TaxID=562976 RepID=A0ABP9YE96_9FUNG
MFFWSTPETRVTPSLRDKTSTVATEQDPLISIESCLQYNSTGSSGSSQKNITGNIVILLHKKSFYLPTLPIGSVRKSLVFRPI